MKRVLVIVSVVLGVLFLFLLWFDRTYSMDVIKPYESGNPESNKRVLIATQGSEYKNGVVNKLINQSKLRNAYFKIIDVTTIEHINVKDWNAIIIFHTWERWKPEPNAENFILSHSEYDNLFVTSTSASGNNKIKGVNGITGASDMSMINDNVSQINKWLGSILIINN